jgi:hypothetical protein
MTDPSVLGHEYMTTRQIQARCGHASPGATRVLIARNRLTAVGTVAHGEKYYQRADVEAVLAQMPLHVYPDREQRSGTAHPDRPVIAKEVP